MSPIAFEIHICVMVDKCAHLLNSHASTDETGSSSAYSSSGSSTSEKNINAYVSFLLAFSSPPKAHNDLKLFAPIDLQCQTCPDPSTCARLLDEKWRQAYNACFRFGPAQPSMVYRYLRGLEGVTPPLALLHLSCQNHAKAFTTTREFLRYNFVVEMYIMDSDSGILFFEVFDRMFSLGVRGSGSGADPVPLGGRVPGVQGPVPGPKRHFLYCSLKP